MTQTSPLEIKYFNKQILDDIINNNNSFTYLMFSSDSVVKNFKEGIKYLSLHKYDFKSKQIIIKLDIRDNYLNKQQINELKKISDLIKVEGGNLAVNDENKDLWSIDNIIFANNRIDNAVETINSLRVPDENNRPLNNLEKLMMAYEICRSLTYNENNENKMHARTIASVLNDGRDIVCVGYAALFQELCTRLNIKCYKHYCKVDNANNEGQEGLHVNNIVVVDKKIFYNDVCWDSAKSGDVSSKYNFFMLPYLDKNKMENKVQTLNNQTTPFVNIVNDKKTLNLASLFPDNEKMSEQLKSQLVNVRLTYDGEIKDLEYFDECSSDLEIKKWSKYLLDKLNEYQVDYSIPVEILEKSLYNLNRACGGTKEISEELSRKTVEQNIVRASTIFKEGATNSFFDDYQRRNANEQKL